MNTFSYTTERFMNIYNGDSQYEVLPYKGEYKNLEDRDIVQICEIESYRNFTAVITRVQYYCDLETVLSVHPEQLVKERNEYVYSEDGYIVFKITRISDI